jgi:hypothetical protein
MNFKIAEILLNRNIWWILLLTSRYSSRYILATVYLLVYESVFVCGITINGRWTIRNTTVFES